MLILISIPLFTLVIDVRKCAAGAVLMSALDNYNEILIRKRLYSTVEYKLTEIQPHELSSFH